MTDTHKPSGGLAVMADRKSGKDALDQFWTPPWATRALCEHILLLSRGTALSANMGSWDPAAGMCLMSDVLADYFVRSHSSDVFDYEVGGGQVGSFVGEGADTATLPSGVDWIITNPPFKLATEFAYRAVREATTGVALLVRLQWLESAERYELFEQHRPAILAPFSGRVPMVQGRWDPDASTATAYAWVVWLTSDRRMRPWEVHLIPPDAHTRWTLPDDAERFAPWSLQLDGGSVLENLARTMCTSARFDPEMLVSVPKRMTLTYREARELGEKDRNATVRVPAWRARIRAADDEFGNCLIRARRMKEAA